MTDKLYKQVDGTEWSWKNLNTVRNWHYKMLYKDFRHFFKFVLSSLHEFLSHRGNYIPSNVATHGTNWCTSVCKHKVGEKHTEACVSYSREMTALPRVLRMTVTILSSPTKLQDLACDIHVHVLAKDWCHQRRWYSSTGTCPRASSSNKRPPRFVASILDCALNKCSYAIDRGFCTFPPLYSCAGLLAPSVEQCTRRMRRGSWSPSSRYVGRGRGTNNYTVITAGPKARMHECSTGISTQNKQDNHQRSFKSPMLTHKANC